MTVGEEGDSDPAPPHTDDDAFRLGLLPDVAPLRVTERPGEGCLWDGHRPTDVGNADRLAAMSDGRIRYVREWGKWMVYREGAWRLDDDAVLVTERAKQVPRHLFRVASELTGEARDEMWKWAKRSEGASALTSMVRLARGIEGIVTDHRDLDRHPWLLNCANGTVDLLTGQLLPHNPDHLLTRQTPTRYEAGVDAPLFTRCLQRWQPDPEVRRYLQLIIGSAASGHPVEHVFVNLGGGSNGKGKFYGAVQHALGDDYAVVPHKSLLIVQRNEQHDTVKARLFGARMAVAGETEAGDRLDEAKLKELTGGDLLEARRMREDPWQFAPSHTLFLHTNHRPRVRGGDEGIWRRLRLIPWDVTIPSEERDENLATKLAAEATGILNWIIEGCSLWRTGGFIEPQVVSDATASYRQDEDHVGRFLADRCEIDHTCSLPAKALRDAYEQWCDEMGERRMSAKEMGPHLTAKGLDRMKMGSTNTYNWIGLRLIEKPEDARF